MSHYLDLLERCLLGTIYKDPPLDPWSGVLRDENGIVFRPEDDRLRQVVTISPGVYDPVKRERGLDWPLTAHTMIGQQRLRQLRSAVGRCLRDSIPGDFIECGVWRGGACIMMAGELAHVGPLAGNRRVFVADSFEGLPKPDGNAADAQDRHHMASTLLAVSEAQVRENFAAYGLLSERVVFLRGWFKDTLPKAPIERLAVLRVDGDMYSSTYEVLDALYEKVSPGGFIIIDDYGAVLGCKTATDEFRVKHNITEPLRAIDGIGVFWRRGKT